jgi:nitrile hydratase subunit beta
MDGVHDLGGKQGFGRVQYSQDAQVFHALWEKKANCLYGHAVRLGIFNMDEYRHAIERMEPRFYMSAGYYERTLTSLASLLVEKQLLSRDELNRRAGGIVPLALPTAAGRSNNAIRQSFKPGDKVQVLNEFVPGHVRLPAYIRGKIGVVVAISPAYPFPDAHAHGVHATDEPTYDVRFDSHDLWGADCDAAKVHVGVFESYLQAVN